MTRLRLVVANWKMNGSLEANAAWVREFAAKPASESCESAVCAPAVYIGQMVSALGQSPVGVGAQDVSEYEKGAYTGEVSAGMLRDIGAEWVIIGHSERRTLFGDTDKRVALKAKAAVQKGLRIILCVGETLAEREEGKTIEVVTSQLEAVMAEVGPEALAEGALAYEPVWAIGTGKTATPAMAQEVHKALRECIAARCGECAAKTRILYGGSVKPGNAAELFAQPDIDGGLIGGAALIAEDFYKICAA